MAKGLISAESKGLDEIIRALQSADDNAQKALHSGIEAWNKGAVQAVKQSYLSYGGAHGDYIYRSISHFGNDTGTVRPTNSGDGVWSNAGVFMIDSIYNSYNAEYKAKQKSDMKRSAMTAAQIAYWMENGVSRLYIDGKAVRAQGFEARMFNLGIYGSVAKTVDVAPKPFVGNAMTTSKNQLETAFVDAFSIKMTELLDNE